jgi:hypothetical protein
MAHVIQRTPIHKTNLPPRRYTNLARRPRKDNLRTTAPSRKKKKLFKQNYYLTASALAHILERHYYKINRHPEAGKFHIELLEIVHYIREAKSITATSVNGCNNMQRIIQTSQPIGFDENGQPATTITIITSPGGNIITAFPGMLPSASIKSVHEVQCHEPKEQLKGANNSTSVFVGNQQMI